MKKKFKILFMLISLSIAMTAMAGKIQAAHLEWDANSEADLKGYYIYQTTKSGDYDVSKKIDEVLAPGTVYQLPALTDETYFWVVTAFDNDGNESDYSNEVSWRVDTTPPDKPVLRLIKAILGMKLWPWNWGKLRIT